jgi:formate dehydrogenase accessory protein FdhD
MTAAVAERADPKPEPGPSAEAAGWRSVPLLRVGQKGNEDTERAVPSERPVAFVYNQEPYTVMMATPADLEDFALGFSLAEGIIKRVGEFGGVTRREAAAGLELDIVIPARRARALAARPRNLAGRTGCGLCGIQSLNQALRPLPVQVPDRPQVTPAAILRAVEQLPDRQPLNRQVHAVHAAAWCGLDGAIRLLREDVGRHNALDKMIGARARAGDAAPGFALITSRLSVEMVQKAATVGMAILVALSAPTTLALEQAAAAGLTLVAGARPEALQVYTHPERIAHS